MVTKFDLTDWSELARSPLVQTEPAIFFFCFLALRPKSTAMVMAGQSVHLTTLFPGQA